MQCKQAAFPDLSAVPVVEQHINLNNGSNFYVFCETFKLHQ